MRPQPEGSAPGRDTLPGMGPRSGRRGSDAASDEDAALLAELRAGDERAFEMLVRTHSAHLLAVARRFVRNDEDARDAVQDAFLSAFRALDRFEGGCRLSTWLHRIVVNACLMRLRTRRRKPEQPIDDLLPTYKPDGHHTAVFVDWSPSAHDALERTETRALVSACIQQLPESYRTALLLRDIEGLELDEIGRLLDVTPNAVKIRVHRARQALRTLLDPHFRQESRP